MYKYFAYGLGIESELPFPELVPSEEPAEILIRFGRLDWEPDEKKDCVVSVTPGLMFFYWKDVGAFCARDGREVVIDPEPQAENHVLRLIILGAVLAGVLHQRGLLLLHASAVRLNGGTVAFVGDKGQGKSTMAATLRSRGHQLVSDDVVAVDTGDGVRVFPGFPQFKLWPDAVASLGMKPESLPRLHHSIEKRAHRVHAQFSTLPAHLKGIFVLQFGEELSVTRVGGREAFIELVRHSYVARHLGPSGMLSSHFQQCSDILKSVPVYRLSRPRDLKLIPEVASCVEDTVT